MLSLFAAAPFWCATVSVHLYHYEVIIPQPALPTDRMASEGSAGGGISSGGDGLHSRDDLYSQAQYGIFVSLPGYGNASLLEVNEVGTDAWQALQDFGLPLGEFDSVEIHGRVTNLNNPGILLLYPPSECLGDFTRDGQVTALDGMPFAQAYASCHINADLTGDGRVDVYDQIMFFHLMSTHCIPAW
ncbi:MAG: hypothetical protein WD114_06900 [Phycisphaerales bacterium]